MLQLSRDPSIPLPLSLSVWVALWWYWLLASCVGFRTPLAEWMYVWGTRSLRRHSELRTVYVYECVFTHSLIYSHGILYNSDDSREIFRIDDAVAKAIAQPTNRRWYVDYLVLVCAQARRNVLRAGGWDFGKGTQTIAWSPPPQKKKFVILSSCENTKIQWTGLELVRSTVSTAVTILHANLYCANGSTIFCWLEGTFCLPRWGQGNSCPPPPVPACLCA
jgi:hypothetical protein